MFSGLKAVICPRCKKAGQVTVHTIFRSVVWLQDSACGHIFEVKKKDLHKLNLTESEVAKCDASIVKDL